MSLHTIAEKLKEFGLNEAQIAVILDMVREFAIEVLKKNLWLHGGDHKD